MKPVPSMKPETSAYWEAAAEGRFILRRCTLCNRFQHPPRHWCPHCWGDDLVWEEASGRGRLVTFSIVRQGPSPAFATPYALAVVELEEGPRMMCNIVECEMSEIAVDMAVEVTFEARGEIALPQFRKMPA